MNEWSTKLELTTPIGDFILQVTEARIFIDLQAELPGYDVLVIAGPSDFLDFISPNRTEILFTAGLNVSLLLFIILGDTGFGKNVHQVFLFLIEFHCNTAASYAHLTQLYRGERLVLVRRSKCA